MAQIAVPPDGARRPPESPAPQLRRKTSYSNLLLAPGARRSPPPGAFDESESGEPLTRAPPRLSAFFDTLSPLDTAVAPNAAVVGDEGPRLSRPLAPPANGQDRPGPPAAPGGVKQKSSLLGKLRHLPSAAGRPPLGPPDDPARARRRASFPEPAPNTPGPPLHARRPRFRRLLSSVADALRPVRRVGPDEPVAPKALRRGSLPAAAADAPAMPPSAPASRSASPDGRRTPGSLARTLGWAFDSFWSWVGYPGEEEHAAALGAAASPARPRQRMRSADTSRSSTPSVPTAPETPAARAVSFDGSLAQLDAFQTTPDLFAATQAVASPAAVLSAAVSPVPLQLGGRNADISALLSQALAELLRPHLPPLQREAGDWTLVYSLDQHGISLRTLYDRAQRATARGNCAGLLLAVRDSGGALFGAFLSDTLRPGVGYYGTGQCFLFRAAASGGVEVFHATGANDYMIHAEPSFIAMGGGDGQFGLWIDQNLLHGFSSYCATFGNPVLSTTAQFECVGLELWTFVL